MFVAWDRRILLVLFAASSCDFFMWTRWLGVICWLGGIGQRHGVVMIVLLHGWIGRTPLHGKFILHEQYIAILPINTEGDYK